jgi:hypothetical protein
MLKFNSDIEVSTLFVTAFTFGGEIIILKECASSFSVFILSSLVPLDSKVTRVPSKVLKDPKPNPLFPTFFLEVCSLA